MFNMRTEWAYALQAMQMNDDGKLLEYEQFRVPEGSERILGALFHICRGLVNEHAATLQWDTADVQPRSILRPTAGRQDEDQDMEEDRVLDESAEEKLLDMIDRLPDFEWDSSDEDERERQFNQPVPTQAGQRYARPTSPGRQFGQQASHQNRSRPKGFQPQPTPKFQRRSQY
ncbi:hypothetical protein BLNAU_22896 [Blattamonas nauphoetae]|uniref:Uncharacterized protein n=1 Tax=Blattamonas nauphoetae TaxID=2049346 RepID=A0ABQ9WRR2_9EUKA|nr:hypothetical protein BLNAU_22896 [Blattamonas nauphoetae]